VHALVDTGKEHLGALDLAHGADQFTVVVVLVEVVGGRPAEVPGHLDLGRDVTEDVAGILVVDDRPRAAAEVRVRPLERRLVRGARHTDGGDARHGARPGEIAVDEQVAATLVPTRRSGPLPWPASRSDRTRSS